MQNICHIFYGIMCDFIFHCHILTTIYYACNSEMEGVHFLTTTVQLQIIFTTHHFYTHVRSGKTLFHYLLMPWSRYPGRLRIIAEDITEGQSAEELDNDVTRINISNCCCDHDKLNCLAS